ncbi:MAG: RidA family protein [Anaerolineaceae bacterium]
METVSPEQSVENKGHYSPGIISNGMLFISGQLSRDPETGETAKGGIADHTLLALANVETVLKAAGLNRESVVQCRVYITDITHWEAVNRVFAEFFGAHKPARAVVPVPALHHGCLVEIEAVAEVDRG